MLSGCRRSERSPRVLVCVMVVVTAMISWATPAPAGDEAGKSPESAIDKLVQQLNDDSFVARDSAQRQLLAFGTAASTQRAVEQALKNALGHPKLEVRAASKNLLLRIRTIAADRQLERLLLPSVDPSTIHLPGWSHFRSLAGDDVPARKLFAGLIRGHFDWLRVLDAMESPSANRVFATVDRSLAKQLERKLDPYQIAGSDAESWAILFCFDSPGVAHGLPNLSSRVSMALGQAGVGPKSTSPEEMLVLKRLIGAWVGSQRQTGFHRERLTIAMRFGCTQQANAVCDQIFADTISTPSEHAVALLCASVLNRSDLEQRLLDRIDDNRTAHVWQLIASRKKKIRTEVRDVAMAMLLHRNGIDPRSVGFTELQADPLLVFRERSLGFADATSRQEAYRAAALALEKKQK